MRKRVPRPLVKRRAVTRLLAKLRLQEHGWIVVDNWDGDLCAVGIAHAARRRTLVYVSTWKKAPGRYAYDCDVPKGRRAWQVKTVKTGKDVGFPTLLRAMTRHLSR